MIAVAIVTISDSCARGHREDISSRTVEEMLPGGAYEVRHKRTLPDEQDMIALELRQSCDRLCADIVFTVGGTGLGPRDVTPEATASVCQRMVPGLSDWIRSACSAKSPGAMLSRAVAGIRGDTLIINLPGAPKAVKDCLEVILPVLPEAVEMMRGTC
jgi:molybdopterin adenylyltransferase